MPILPSPELIFTILGPDFDFLSRGRNVFAVTAAPKTLTAKTSSKIVRRPRVAISRSLAIPELF